MVVEGEALAVIHALGSSYIVRRTRRSPLHEALRGGNSARWGLCTGPCQFAPEIGETGMLTWVVVIQPLDMRPQGPPLPTEDSQRKV